MSEPLKDVRTKVSVECWALLEAESRGTGREQAEVIREILHGWAQKRADVLRVAQSLLRVTGSERA